MLHYGAIAIFPKKKEQNIQFPPKNIMYRGFLHLMFSIFDSFLLFEIHYFCIQKNNIYKQCKMSKLIFFLTR